MQTSTSYQKLSPVILNDDLFLSTVGTCLFSGTAAQRQMAYLAAEQQMEDWMGTPIFATNITGSFTLPSIMGPLVLEHVHVNSIPYSKAYFVEDCNCTLTEQDACTILLNPEFGYVHAQALYNLVQSQCGMRRVDVPLTIELVYNAGYPTGVMVQDTSLHMALVVLAQENLNMLINPSAVEGEGAGIKSYSTLGYSETRNEQRKTPFGQTARSGVVAQFVKHLKKPLRTLGIPRRRF